MKIPTVLAVLGLVTVGVANGQQPLDPQQPAHIYQDSSAWFDGHFVYVTPNRYTANELSLDLFGTYMHPEEKIEHLFKTNIRKDGTWGGGVGLNYFFLRNVGIGADINIPDNGGPAVDHIAGSLLVRLPIGPSGWAPYLFGGGGRGTDPVWEWQGHGGVGMEYRWNPLTGIFMDGRYVWPDKSTDRLLLRAGLRIVF